VQSVSQVPQQIDQQQRVVVWVQTEVQRQVLRIPATAPPPRVNHQAQIALDRRLGRGDQAAEANPHRLLCVRLAALPRQARRQFFRALSALAWRAASRSISASRRSAAAAGQASSSSGTSAGE